MINNFSVAMVYFIQTINDLSENEIENSEIYET